jgi:group I intron endonuclease
LKEIIINNPYGFIYITTNLINGKKYIGQKTFDIYYHWKNYLGSGLRLNRAIKKYGRNNFKKEIIDITYSKEDSDKKEKQYIEFFNAVASDDFYNIAYGGQDTTTLGGRKLSDITRKRISDANKGKHNKPLSNETREKISNSHKGMIASDIARKNMSIAHIGMKHTEESKFKMSRVQKGHKGLTYTQDNKRFLSQIKGGKIILQYDMNENLINQFVSMHEAENITGYARANIKRCCDGFYKQSKGYIWRYGE